MLISIHEKLEINLAAVFSLNKISEFITSPPHINYSDAVQKTGRGNYAFHEK